MKNKILISIAVFLLSSAVGVLLALNNLLHHINEQFNIVWIIGILVIPLTIFLFVKNRQSKITYLIASGSGLVLSTSYLLGGYVPMGCYISQSILLLLLIVMIKQKYTNKN